MTIAAGPPPAADPKTSIFTRDFLITGAAAFGFFMVNFSYFSTLPLYIQARGGSEADVSLVVGAGGLMSLLARPFVGWLVDSLGRRPMLIIGTGLALISSVSYAFAVSLPLIVVSRMFGGAALSAVSTSATTLINDSTPPLRRGEANSYFGMAINVATGIGPPLGAFIVAATFLAPLEQAFSTFVPAVGAAGNFTLLFLTGVVMAGFGMFMAFLARDPYPAKGIQGPPRFAGMFRREAALLGLLNFCNTVCFAGVLSLVPIYARNNGLDNPGLFFTVYSALIFLMRIVSGRASDRYGRAVVFLPGMALVGLSMFLLALTGSPLLMLLAAVLYGAGQGLSQPTMTAYAADLVPAQARGAAISTYSLGFDVGLSFGAWGLGAVVAAGGIQTAFLTAGVIPFLGIAWFLLRTRSAKLA